MTPEQLLLTTKGLKTILKFNGIKLSIIMDEKIVAVSLNKGSELIQHDIYQLEFLYNHCKATMKNTELLDKHKRTFCKHRAIRLSYYGLAMTARLTPIMRFGVNNGTVVKS